MHDTIDDLHYAEDTLATLRIALDAIVAHVDREPAAPLPAELVTQAREAVAAGREYCRCEYDETEGWLCDDDCGCPADHEHPHHKEPMTETINFNKTNRADDPGVDLTPAEVAERFWASPKAQEWLGVPEHIGGWADDRQIWPRIYDAIYDTRPWANEPLDRS